MKGLFFIVNDVEKKGITQEAIEKLQKTGKKVGFFQPVGEKGLYTFAQAKQMLAENKADELIADVILSYKKQEKENDFVVVDGADFDTCCVGAFILNKLLARHLCLPVVLVVNEGCGDLMRSVLAQSYINILGVITKTEQLEKILIQAQEESQKYISHKMFEYNLSAQASLNKQRIVLPEGTCERVLRAGAQVAQRQIAEVIVLGNPEEITQKAKEWDICLEDVKIVNYLQADNFEDYANTLCELRKAKGMTIEEARELMKDGAYYGTMMVYKNDADGMVSGAEHTTANTIRPALQFIKTKPGFTMVSGAFLMCMNGKLNVFADCAVTPNPTAEQLAETAVTTAQTARLFGLEPKVAFLSYGTGDSGKGPSVDLVKDAVRLTKEKAPDFDFEGPIQFDAAVDEKVAQTKLPNSVVAGKANVFVFPDLNTGNCCYKAIQRALGDDCLAVGPILQGLNKPVNDLSRGATVRDIINTIAFTALFAQKQ